MIVILLGSSAAGKSFLVHRVLPKLDSDFQIVPKYISRAARTDEISEDGSLKNTDIIPGTDKEFIETLDYHYVKVRKDKTGYYGFKKEAIDSLLSSGKIPIINNCDETTYRKLCMDYPNQILTIYVDHCDRDPQIMAEIMKIQGRRPEEIEERLSENSSVPDEWYEVNPNSIAIFNPAYPRIDKEYAKPLYPFVCMQLIKIFLSIYEDRNKAKENLFRQKKRDLTKSVNGDKSTQKALKQLDEYFKDASKAYQKRRFNGRQEVSISKIRWWKWVTEEMASQEGCDVFFDPKRWNEKVKQYGFPQVPVANGTNQIPPSSYLEYWD